MVTQLRTPIKVTPSQTVLNVIDRRNALLHSLLNAIESNPKLAVTPTRKGEQPIAFIWRLFREGFLADNLDEGKSTATIVAVRSQLNNAWKVIEAMLRSMSSSTRKSFRVLHAAAGCECPLELFQFIIVNFPEQVHEVNEEGQNILEIALASSIQDKSEFAKKIELILKANPSAAGIRNHKRRYPLHEALSLKCSGSWEDFTVLDTFVKAAPGALTTKDIVTGMFAFQIAASSGDSIIDLSKTYHILRQMPCLIKDTTVVNSANKRRRL